VDGKDSRPKGVRDKKTVEVGGGRVSGSVGEEPMMSV